MLVYGKRLHVADPAAWLAELQRAYATTASLPGGIDRHGKLVTILIEAGQIAQGLADARMAAAGEDDMGPEQQHMMGLLMTFAGVVLRSWDSGFAAALPPRLAWTWPKDVQLPKQIEFRRPEGFSYYAVYPESYAVAARCLGTRDARVIGLRSIGTSLAAMTAAALGAPSAVTVRPVGHPFDRKLAISPSLAAVLKAEPDRLRIVVDEGPGLSGSSFGAALDWLADAGIPERNMACIPSHAGRPGVMARTAHVARWNRVKRVPACFESLVLGARPAPHRLEQWFADLVGAPMAPLQDVSGGTWRRVRGIDAPVLPGLERRKFLLRTARGVWLLKFAGLGRVGAEKFAMSCRLAEAGLVSAPLAARHGFTIEPWLEARVPDAPGYALVERIGQYLGWRARNLSACGGAGLDELARMARHNVSEGLGAGAGRALRFEYQGCRRPIHIDGRLHRWEWLCLPDGRVLKSDAVDHADAHDLVGPQDVAWDIAGAIVEFDLAPEDARRLRRIVCSVGGVETDPMLVDDHVIHYCAFQLGLWTQHGSCVPARYARHLLARQAVGQPG